MVRTAFPEIDLDGTPYEMGLQHGRENRRAIERALAIRLGLVCQTLPLTPGECFRLSKEYADLYARLCPSTAEEVEGLARGAGLDLDEAWFLQTWEEVGHVERAACCCVAAGGEATREGGLLVGMNLDAPPWTSEEMVLVRRTPKSGPRSLQLSCYGELGSCGINAEGMAVFNLALAGARARGGAPARLLCRMALEAESAAGWLAAFEKTPPAAMCNLLVADAKDGRIINVECAGGAHEVTYNGSGLYVHANTPHAPAFQKPQAEDQEDPSRVREVRMLLLADQYRGGVTVEILQAILSDHQNYPQYSICRHSAGPNRLSTLASFVAEPNEGALNVCLGPPCEGGAERREL